MRYAVCILCLFFPLVYTTVGLEGDQRKTVNEFSDNTTLSVYVFETLKKERAKEREAAFTYSLIFFTQLYLFVGFEIGGVEGEALVFEVLGKVVRHVENIGECFQHGARLLRPEMRKTTHEGNINAWKD